MDVAIGMMLFIFVIANVGGLYFYLRDRKQNACKAIEAMRRQSEQNGNDRLTLDDINNITGGQARCEVLKTLKQSPCAIA